MQTSSVQELSLSVEEFSLSLSLCGRSDLGKNLLDSVFGIIEPEKLQERLISASHSLIARHLCSISPTATILLDEKYQVMLLPVLRFNSLIQFVINGSEGLPALMNIHLGKEGTFTAGRVEWGVTQQIWHGPLTQLPDWLAGLLPTDPQRETCQPIPLSMVDFSAFQQQETEIVKKNLIEKGFPETVAQRAAQAITQPQQRGSMLNIPAGDEEISKFKDEKAGPGILFTSNQEGAFIFLCDSFSDSAVGQLMPARPNEIKAFVLLLTGGK